MNTLGVAVELPRHGELSDVLSYSSPEVLPPGTIVLVPLGKRVVRGIVWEQPEAAKETDGVALREVMGVATGLAPLSQAWRDLVTFAAAYYQRSTGEVAMGSLPPQLRQLDDAQLGRVMVKLGKPAKPGSASKANPADPTAIQDTVPELSAAQASALAAIQTHEQGTTLLWGVTGSGKTEIYLRAAQRALDAGRQVLVLVPEINLTPQLEARFARRFAQHGMASLHSGLTPAQRLSHWLAAHLGRARLVLGTRLAVFASMPQLGLIIVDEEHDPSFKQQEGARYSARDLAVWRGQHEHIPVLLGSATPSLESWKRAAEGRYRRVDLRERIGAGVLPQVRLVDMQALPREVQKSSALAPAVLEAIRLRIERGEQSMVLLNRRGYTPVLHCISCGWKSECPHCSAWRVFHKPDRSLRCHHCGFNTRVPRACPECGDLDIAGIGRGTQKLEEQLATALPGARVARIDADTVRKKGELQAQLAAVHDGEVDVLVGTQMVAKGHDFRRITLVVAVDPDSALFSSDFRAPERLFALLMQAAGRAGRDAAQAASSQIWVQTWHAKNVLYATLQKHDFEGFAASQLEQRQRAQLPPFTSLALLRADAREAAHAEAFLEAAAEAARELPPSEFLSIYPPVPLPVARVADTDRMQMLIESPSRLGLQRLLSAWAPRLRELKAQHKSVLRYAVDVDPAAI